MTGEIHEECGVFGIFAAEERDVAHTVYTGLYALQHRGQEGCGIAVNSGGCIQLHKDAGLAGEVFSQAVLGLFRPGRMAVGHVRYGTTGGSGRENAQPILTKHPACTMAIVHNGNLANACELRRSLEQSGAIFHTTSDTEMISHIITRRCMETKNILKAVESATGSLDGAYSMLLLFPDRLMAVRDKNGFRPLCYGVTPNGDYVIASESCALDAAGAKFVRDVRPGEILMFDDTGVHGSTIHCEEVPFTPCIFEYIYFARSDSVIDGSSVHRARLNAGRFLAMQNSVDADIVIGVPDSGIDAAVGYSMQAGIPYGLGFIKNRYIGRTFINPKQSTREKMVRIKLNPITEAVAGKRVVMIDDSIVRGTTCARIVGLLRDAGAKEIHVRITAPPFLFPCYYGTDVDSKEKLIACRHSISEVCSIIGADTLEYLDIKYLPRLISENGDRTVCCACFNGNYPTPVPEDQCEGKNIFESDIANGEMHI